MSAPPLLFCVFFFNDTATTEIYTLSLHDALPILQQVFLGLLGKALAVLRRAVLARAGRQGAPQLVDLLLGIGLALLALGPLARQAFLGGAAVTVHAQVGQRVAGVQPLLHRRQAMALRS